MVSIQGVPVSGHLLSFPKLTIGNGHSASCKRQTRAANFPWFSRKFLEIETNLSMFWWANFKIFLNPDYGRKKSDYVECNSKYLLTLYKTCKMQMLAALLTDVRNLFTSIILIALEYGACRSGIKLDLYFYCPPKGSWPKECSEVTVSLGWRLICCKDLQVLRCWWCDGLVFIKYEIFMAFQMRDFEACGNVEYYVLPPV